MPTPELGVPSLQGEVHTLITVSTWQRERGAAARLAAARGVLTDVPLSRDTWSRLATAI